jgi:NAD-dependent SIR2 family protein deacetylase
MDERAGMKLALRDVRRINSFWKPFEMKFCNKCGKTKSFDEFDIGIRIQAHCRACTRLIRKAWRKTNPEKARQRDATSQAKHRAGGRDPNKPWPEECSYNAAHKRPVAIHGPAKNYPCCVCGNQAEEWSYNYQDPNERYEKISDNRNNAVRNLAYSGDPSFYQPMCHPCHTSFDKKHGKATSGKG